MRKNDQANQPHQREYWIVQTSYSPPSTTKNKKQESISDLGMLTNTKKDSINNKTNHEIKDDIVQNTICNRRIEHATTVTIVNTKCTLDIRPEKQNSVISSSDVHHNIFVAIK